LSPDNGTEGWDWCSGYHYSSDSIAGFSHTHLNGTGIGDWCDISFMPLADTINTSKRFIKYPFQHKNEKAKPGYYSVLFNNGIRAELTTSERAGYHRYQFPNKQQWLRVDMGFHINWDKPTDAALEKINDSTIAGYRFSTGWAKNQRVFFAAVFSEKIKSFRFIQATTQINNNNAKGKEVKLLIEFVSGTKTVFVKTGISSVSTTAALEATKELKGISFTAQVKKAETLWEKALEKIQIDTSNKSLATKFYTALYRTKLAPSLYSDADGTYRNQDNRVLQMQNGTKRYTIFSLWDTFRALHPLLTISQPDIVAPLINSLLQFQKDNGLLPVWDISTWEANTMTGYHAIPVIADAILKNIPGFDVEAAYEAMKKSANQQQRGTQEYIQYGYLPQEKHGWSVTITLEYAFDDWCIAQVAKKLDRFADYDIFMSRAQSYQKLFDASTGFMRAKNANGKFIEPFDPLLSEHGFDGQYIEGTAWQHSFFVPHDIDGLANLYGGKEKLVAKLDALFTAPSVLHGENTSADVTGLIGQYAHGNEPSHHIIYMYTALGHPEKAAKWIRVVADSMYKTGPDGLTGNDDCGQMSAWYVFTALGMYPMNPASGEYVFGFPLVKKATLQLPGNKTLQIETINKAKNSATAFIKEVWLNGKKLDRKFITHTELLEGGRLVYRLDR
jgi:predicted alpha-1,2-mannosidase